jgi:hypothetical protein
MSPEDNEAIIRGYVGVVWNQQQLDRADEVVTLDFLDHAPVPGQGPGLAGAKNKWAIYLAGIPDLRVTIEEQVAEGDKVFGPLLPATESEHERDAADERVRVVESALGRHVAAAALALSAPPYRLTQSGQSAAVMPSG